MKLPEGRGWRLPDAPVAEAMALGRELHLSPIVAAMLHARGFRNPEDAQAFLTPLDQPLPCTNDLTELDKAAQRLYLAREREEAVLVYGDYDVDGVSATALATRGLRKFGIEKLESRVPERDAEGYGLRPEMVDSAHESGISVILTVDNGISAREAADRADALGINLLVTDHHEIEGELPKAYACINPKRESAVHALHDACGAAIAWALIRELLGDLEQPLAYTALGTIGDVMPLLGVNRTLVARGLRALTQGAQPGISALAKVSNVDMRELRAEHVGFQLAPRINATGRMGNAAAALELLLTNSPADAGQLARALDSANEERREIERGLFDDVVELLDGQVGASDRVIAIAGEDWHTGVLGIVASRVAERFNLPAALMSIRDGEIQGSARGRPGFNLVAALSECKEFLTRFGGHHGAAGFSLAEGSLDGFVSAFQRAASGSGWEPTADEVEIDALLSLSEIDAQFMDEIALLEPFGRGNPEPVFATCGVSFPEGSVREYRGGHLGLKVRHGDREFSAIAFSMGELAPMLQARPGPYDVAYRPKFNVWRGMVSIQLQIQSIRESAE